MSDLVVNHSPISYLSTNSSINPHINLSSEPLKVCYPKELSPLDTMLQNCYAAINSPFNSFEDHSKQAFSTESTRDCFSLGMCHDIDFLQFHPREVRAAISAHFENIDSRSITLWEKMKEYLRFRDDDPREKFLYLVAEEDDSLALDPVISSHILSILSQIFDLKYKLINSTLDVCNEVDMGDKKGKLTHVLIEAHGEPDGMIFGKGLDGILVKDDVLRECFSGLEPNGRIILYSCSTGGISLGHLFNNLAQKIADVAKRVVVASRESVESSKTKIISTDPFMLFQKEDDEGTNAFKVFKPNFVTCSPTGKERVHENELKVIDAIESNFETDSLLPPSVTCQETREYFGFCQDDPRDKAFFAHYAYPRNEALEPKNVAKVLKKLSENFDLKYKVVRSLQDICNGITDASKWGKVGVVFIAHNTPIQEMPLSHEPGKVASVNARMNFSSCFSTLTPRATIILLGPTDDPQKHTIAQKIADDTRRAVITAIANLNQELAVLSIDPFSLGYAKQPSLMDYFWRRPTKYHPFNTTLPS